MGITAPGRMINTDISRSKKIASLSPKAMSLFCLLIPHFNAHGKMLANVHLIKGLICPYIEWLTVDEIEPLLMEISDKTNVKYWTDDSGEYLQSLNWIEHQQLRSDRLGKDFLPDYPEELPDYSRTTPGLLPPEVEVEVKEKVREEEDQDLYKLLPADLVSTDSTDPPDSFVAAEKRLPVSECITLYRKYFGVIQENMPTVTVLQDICHLYPPERIREAFMAVPGAGANNLNWVIKRLQNGGKPAKQKTDWEALIREHEAEEAKRGIPTPH
jgi:hypothetical protein